jgi:YVTN family beta-propeller protein
LLTRRVFALAPAAALIGCGSRNVSGFDGYAFIANADGQALAVIDLNTFTPARHIALYARPTAVLAPARRPFVYALAPDVGLLFAVSTADFSARRRLRVGHTAISMRLTHDGGAIWVLCRDPRELVRVELGSFRTDARIALPADPYDFDLAPAGAGAAAVVSFGDSGTFALVDLTSRKCRVFDLGRKLSMARFRSDGRQVLIAAAENPQLSIADAHSGRVVVHLPLAVRARNLCFKSDGGQLFITGDGMDAVVVVYPFTTEVAETALAGRAPGFMAECASEDTDYLFVTNPASGEVTIVDIDTRRVIAVVAVGRSPGFIAMTPDARYALVLNEESGDMAVIRVAAIAAKRDRSAPLFTMVPIGSRPVSAAVRAV